MKDNSKTTIWRGKESIFGKMATNIWEIGKIISDKDKELLSLKMEVNISENGIKIKDRALA